MRQLTLLPAHTFDLAWACPCRSLMMLCLSHGPLGYFVGFILTLLTAGWSKNTYNDLRKRVLKTAQRSWAPIEKQTIQRIKWRRTPYKKKYLYRSLALYFRSLVIVQPGFFCRPNLFLLGVPVIFSPFSAVLIFASLYQNKEERKKLQDKVVPASPQLLRLILSFQVRLCSRGKATKSTLHVFFGRCMHGDRIF